MKRLALLMLAIMPAFLVAQEESAAPDPWKTLEFFVGSWKGSETGRAGIGKGEREYSYILGEKFIHFKNKSTFEPQEQNPKGEVHEDWGFFSFDSNRDKVVLRQFHVEGFVNQYVLDSLSPDGKTIVLVTESIENIPDGWRARYRFKIHNDSEFTEIFELAAPGNDFEPYLENHWKRKN